MVRLSVKLGLVSIIQLSVVPDTHRALHMHLHIHQTYVPSLHQPVVQGGLQRRDQALGSHR